MWRTLLAFVSVATSVALVAQTAASGPDKSDVKRVALCTVSGRVVKAFEGGPLKSARVTLVMEYPKSRPQFYQSTSDSEGHFVLPDVAPGRYELFAAHAGLVNQYYQSQGTDEGAVLALKPGQKVTDVLLRMTVAAVVTGRVNDEETEPMAGLEVTALQRPTDEDLDEAGPFQPRTLNAISSAVTDDRGQYRIFGLKPGEYYLKATESDEPQRGIFQQDFFARQVLGNQYVPLYYPGVLQIDQAQVVSLSAGEEVQADFSMRHTKAMAVAGRVIAQGGPVRNASVNLMQPETGDDDNRRYTATDEKGNFRLTGVPSGSYTITANLRDGDKVYRGRERIDVGNDNIESLTILLGSGATLRGRITVAGPGSPALDRIHVLLIPMHGEQEVILGQVKRDGTFEITSVADGSYAVEILGLEHDWYPKSVRIGLDDVVEKGLQVEKGTCGGALEIGLSLDSAQLDGSVNDRDHTVAGARVRIMPDPETPYNKRRSQVARTDQAGHFVLTGLRPGKYRVLARLPSSTQDAFLKSEPKSVTLSERDHQTMQLTILRPADE